MLIGPNGSFSSAVADAATSYIPAPENIFPISIETDEDEPFKFTGVNEVQIDDGSEQNNELNVSLQVTNGTLSVTPVNALANSVTGNGTSTILIEGLRSDINTTLESLEFTPDRDYHNDSGSPVDTLTVESWADVGRQLYFSFDTNDPSVVIDDNAGTSNNGMIVGDATIDSGGFVEMNGAGAIEIQDDLAITDQLTFATWIEIPPNIPGNPLRMEFISINASVGLYYEPAFGRTLVGTFNDGTSQTTSFNFDLHDGIRHHIAYTIDSINNRQSLYIDGELVQETNHRQNG